MYNNSAALFSDEATYWSKHVLVCNSQHWLTSQGSCSGM